MASLELDVVVPPPAQSTGASQEEPAVGLAQQFARVREYSERACPPLAIEASQGPGHYLARLHYHQDLKSQTASGKQLQVERSFHDPETGAPVTSTAAGHMVKVRLVVLADGSWNEIALSDWMPAGLEAINTRFATSPDVVPGGDDDGGDAFYVAYRELRDDSVHAFSRWLWRKRSVFEYLTRATTVGTFVVPAATIEAMYDPDINGRTKPGTFTVEARR